MTDKTGMKEEKIRRFCAARLIEHWTHVGFFVILVITGLSQKFYFLDTAQLVILKLGGIDSVRVLHRYAGVGFLGLLALHVFTAAGGITLRKWQPSMMITRKDFRDAVHNMRYYMGFRDQPALCDRYNYKQKFEYWGILIGAVIMVVSGLSLWFPATVTQLLPGETIPVAKALHTNEALLILLIIAIWHVYNAVFSPEVFPLDTAVFTGLISRERMVREHPLELARKEGTAIEDETDDTRAEDFGISA